jgi:preprotein translocase subunit SecE
MAKSKSSAATTTTAEPKEDNAVVKYYKETRAELRKVTWPTQDEAKNLTLIIVAVAFAMSAFLGTVDYIFQTTVSGIIASDAIYIGLAVILFFAGAAGFYFNNQQE